MPRPNNAPSCTPSAAGTMKATPRTSWSKLSKIIASHTVTGEPNAHSAIQISPAPTTQPTSRQTNAVTRIFLWA